MINLLPPAYADKIRFGRMNSRLIKWLAALLAALLILILILAFGWLYIERQSKNLQRDIDTAKQQLQAQNLTGVKKEAQEISTSIKTINQVLGQEIRFSALLQDIGKAMPAGTVLDSLQLDNINGAIDVRAKSHDHTAAAQIAVNLSDPDYKLFQKVDIVSTNCGTQKDATGYECSVLLRALFDKDFKKRYLNIPKGSGS